MTYKAAPAFVHTSGPSKPRLVLVGEAWGESEQTCGRPFAGESGKELFRMLGQAMPEVEPELHAEICAQHRYGTSWIHDRELWLVAAGISMTNVLALRPPDNKLEALCGTKAEVGGNGYLLPPITKGKYLKTEFLSEVNRLTCELQEYKPNLIVALGNTACWALLRATNIGSIRGTVTTSIIESDRLRFKCLPSYHPAGVLRNWSWRPIVVADLMKAHREAQFPEIIRPERAVTVSPTISEVLDFTQRVLAQPPSEMGVDIETEGGQITCIGFATSRAEALVIPFWDRAKSGWSYWPDQATEETALNAVAALLESPIPKVFQNGLYDLQYICKYGIRPAALAEDTMLLHHSLYPELQKGLGFLGSIYTSEASWKLMNRRGKQDSEKRDE